MMKRKIDAMLVVVFIGLSIFDLVANAGAIVVPMFGAMTETVFEFINELLQIVILGYFFAITKK